MAGEHPQYFMYSTDELTRRTVHIRHAFRTEFITLFPFDTLGGMKTNADGDRVYRPDYAELDRIVISMMTHERTRMINSVKLRTDEGDKEFIPRTRQANDITEPDDDTEAAPGPKRQPLIRSKLIVYWGNDSQYIQIKFTTSTTQMLSMTSRRKRVAT